jgi:SAM-dependent methyltransferase
MGLLDAVKAAPLARRIVRRASDWVDLQLSLIVASLREVAPRARGRLLDVGCGDKPFEDLFLPHVTEYVGIEHEATFAATATGTKVAAATAGEGKRPDLTYDGETLPFPDRSFDTVLSIQVLEHTPKPRRLVAEMARVLADDGLLILLAPFQFRLHEEPHDYYRYSAHGLRHLCEEAGLEVTEVRQQGSLWSVLGHKLNTFLAFRVGRIGGLAQDLGKLGHEQATTARPRLWTLPLVGASMVSIAGAARVLDAVLTEPDEMLNVMVLARRRRTDGA